MMVDNGMVEELQDLPDEYIGLIDREKIGRLVLDKGDGIFIGGCFCATSSYEEPDMKIEIAEPENCFFRLLIAPAPQNDEPAEKFAQWISLPQTPEMLNEFAAELGEGCIEDCVFYEFQSALPFLEIGDMKDIYQLNELAGELSELSRRDVVKLKAVMQAEKIHSASDARYAIGRLREYELDVTLCGSADYGRLYLERNLPVNFDRTVLTDVDLYEFGSAVLDRKQGAVTPYGIVSGRGQSLYSAVTAGQEPELAEDCGEELSEDEPQDFSMGM